MLRCMSARPPSHLARSDHCWQPSARPCRQQTHRRSRGTPAPLAAAAAAGGGGGGGLVDPTAAGPRRVVVAPKLDPRLLEDVRKAQAFGPRGLLLVGMDEAGCAAVAAWFQSMEPGFVVSPCPTAQLAAPGATLRQAVEGGGADAAALPARRWEAPPADAPPVAFFSGMSGEEQVAVMEGWVEHTGLEPPAFAAVTPTILDKPLSRLLADIVRAQAQQAPPGYDAEASAAAPVVAVGGGASAAPGGEPGAGGGEQVLRSKLQDYVMLNAEGQTTQAAPMSLDALKEQIQEKVRQKKAAAAAEERAARKAATADETDRLRQALRSGKQGGKKQGKQQKNGGGTGGKGFGG